eukprot:2647459-Amphidinium_carterae.2
MESRLIGSAIAQHRRDECSMSAHWAFIMQAPSGRTPGRFVAQTVLADQRGVALHSEPSELWFNQWCQVRYATWLKLSHSIVNGVHWGWLGLYVRSCPTSAFKRHRGVFFVPKEVPAQKLRNKLRFALPPRSRRRQIRQSSGVGNEAN